MTKQQLIVWLRDYIKACNSYKQKRNATDQLKEYIKKYQAPLQKEKKKGVIKSILSGITVAFCGAVPCALVFGVIWFVWFFIDIFKTDLRHNPEAEELSVKVIQSAAGIVIEDVDTFFYRHAILGPAIGSLIIGLGISVVIGCIFTILSIISDKRVPERNKKHEEEFESNQKLLAATQIKYNLRKKESDDAWRNVKRLENKSPIPEDYLPWAEEILRIFENQRADTVKEAINILHTDWHRQDELEETKRHNEIIERQNAQNAAELARSAEAANRAAEAANEAAYWEKKRYIDEIFDDLLK